MIIIIIAVIIIIGIMMHDLKTIAVKTKPLLDWQVDPPPLSLLKCDDWKIQSFPMLQLENLKGTRMQVEMRLNKSISLSYV